MLSRKLNVRFPVLLIGVFVAGAVLSTSPLSAAKTLRVPGDFATIQEAVDAAEPGDKIEVAPGEYDGAEITKRVTIIGSGRETRITGGEPIDGIGAFIMFSHAADGTKISDLVIEGPKFGVFGSGVDNVTVTNLLIIDAFHPIDNRGGNGWQITHNTIDGLTPTPFRTRQNDQDAILVVGPARDRIAKGG